MIDLAPCATKHSIFVNVAHHCFCLSALLHGVLDDRIQPCMRDTSYKESGLRQTGACRLNDRFLLTSSPCQLRCMLWDHEFEPL